MKQLRHIGIVVSNLERSLDFYRKLLCPKVTKTKEESGKYIDKIVAIKKVKVTTIKMMVGDRELIELLYYKAHSKTVKERGLNNIGISHIAFTVKDIDKEYRRLSRAGIQFNSPPQASPGGYTKVVFCKDPDGNFIELVQVLEEK